MEDLLRDSGIDPDGGDGAELGRVVQVDGIKTRVQSAYDFST